MTQYIEHALPWVEVRALECLCSLRLALGAIVLGKATVHDVTLVMQLRAHVSDDECGYFHDQCLHLR